MLCARAGSVWVCRASQRSSGQGQGSRWGVKIWIARRVVVCVFCALLILYPSPPRLGVASRVCLRVTARLCPLWELNELVFGFRSHRLLP